MRMQTLHWCPPPPPLAQTWARLNKSAEAQGHHAWTGPCLRATHTMEHMLQTSPKPTRQNTTIQRIILICTMQVSVEFWLTGPPVGYCCESAGGQELLSITRRSGTAVGHPNALSMTSPGVTQPKPGHKSKELFMSHASSSVAPSLQHGSEGTEDNASLTLAGAIHGRRMYDGGGRTMKAASNCGVRLWKSFFRILWQLNVRPNVCGSGVCCRPAASVDHCLVALRSRLAQTWGKCSQTCSNLGKMLSDLLKLHLLG